MKRDLGVHGMERGQSALVTGDQCIPIPLLWHDRSLPAGVRQADAKSAALAHAPRAYRDSESKRRSGAADHRAVGEHLEAAHSGGVSWVGWKGHIETRIPN